MRLRQIKGARLTLDNGAEVLTEYLGKGQFHVCYVDRARSQVYSVTIDRPVAQDYSKEILSKCDESPHIPPVTYLGDIDNTERRVYRMPLYRPMLATQHKAAFAQLKALKTAREQAWTQIYNERVHAMEYRMRVTDIGYLVNQRTVNLLEASGAVCQALLEALVEVMDTASMYGSSYCFEFSKRNVMVDDAGTLVLLDVLFDLEAVEAINNARMKKARGY